MKFTKWNSSLLFGVHVNYPTTDIVITKTNFGHPSDFILIAKGHETLIARELDDKLFSEGWRFKRYLTNSEVDLPEFLALEEERKLLELSESVEPRNKIYDTSFIDETESGSRWQSNIEIY